MWVGCAEPLAWLCPDEGGAEVSPRALDGAGGWQGWSFGLFGSLHWLCGLEEVGKPKAQPVSVGQPKPSKIPKIPIIVYVFGELKQLP